MKFPLSDATRRRLINEIHPRQEGDGGGVGLFVRLEVCDGSGLLVDTSVQLWTHMGLRGWWGSSEEPCDLIIRRHADAEERFWSSGPSVRVLLPDRIGTQTSGLHRVLPIDPYICTDEDRADALVIVTGQTDFGVICARHTPGGLVLAVPSDEGAALAAARATVSLGFSHAIMVLSGRVPFSDVSLFSSLRGDPMLAGGIVAHFATVESCIEQTEYFPSRSLYCSYLRCLNAAE